MHIKSLHKEVKKMRRLLSFFLAGVFLSAILLVATVLSASAALPPNDMIGTVTLVGDNTMKILDDSTGIEHDFKISESQEENLTTGYTVELQTENGRVVSYTVLGVPANVEQIVYSTRGFDEF
jgi:ABC-type transport system substrate-binding protein